MFLERFQVKNYRSISEIDLSPCGAFNVLIGKNGAGKSNILASVDAFFALIRSTTVNTDPGHGNEIDFFQKETANPISLEATIRMTDHERESLFAAIAQERSQVRNLLDALQGQLKLTVRLSIKAHPKKHAIVTLIRILSSQSQTESTLYEVSDQSCPGIICT